jgi:transposase
VRNITTIGVDLAKNLFQVHGVDERGKVVLRRALKRAEMSSFFARIVPCLIGMEACGGAHFWARKLSELGHTVRLMAPQFVKPYVKTNKSDARDAEAICEAVARPNMRFVPIKTVEQQALLAVHRVRQAFVSARTAQSNQLRGLLSEFGIVMPKGTASRVLWRGAVPTWLPWHWRTRTRASSGRCWLTAESIRPTTSQCRPQRRADPA